MKFLIDFFPILLFFVAYKMGDIYNATGILMAATVLQMLIVWRMEGKLQTMHKITLALVLGFGALTLLTDDKRYIMWKPTVLYAGMAIVLAVAHGVFKKNALKILLNQQLKLPTPVWNKLNISWVIYCVFMASINAYVATYFSTDAWFDFKIWGYVFPLVFILGQGVYVSRHLPKEE